MDVKMPQFLKKRAFLTPERPALIYNNQLITFMELYQESLSLAGRLTAVGIGSENYTAVLIKNNLDSSILLYALQLCGVPTVMLNNRLTSAEIAWQLQDSNAQFLISEPSLLSLAKEASSGIEGLQTVSLAELSNKPPTEFAEPDEIALDQVCTVMYTSGTTGHPKGVLQTYGNHWWSAAGSALNLGLTDQDTWLCTVPLFHISGYSILMRGIIYGNLVVLHDHFDPKQVVKDIFEKKVSYMSVVGTSLNRVLEELEPRKLPDTFRAMLLGGGPAPLPLLEACINQNVPVFQTYGMTETASQSATLAPEYSLSKLGSAGKPLFPVSIKIQLPDGSEAPAGAEGEILVKGPNVTPGYLNKPDVTAEKIINGWLHTGDIGRMDEEGFLYVVDRRSDLIISGGENIYPAEVESVLVSHPDIWDAGVTGVPDDRWGQVPAAFIIPMEGRTLTEEDLRDYCLTRLAKYKVPRDFYFVKELPRNAANKLLRRKLLGLIGGNGQ
ncbi:O-succinylbenzoate-CoA ligase [Bacillus sp. FJAT-27225]|uniref:o-succinylbenzoate--CoA ligase n=1 Tax=Bacillus sp. FJAT-27225 TaxID=1743144 RepID=UPI00080C233C|nr:o-succinylbenzoate--CoA ligase [Bacillus sp. FJAT-27225]OCA91469.1 O-succinylbenzoate-CoA ligase [Bacillus sp. FJAT-27225]